MRALLTADRRAAGRNVVDLRGVLVERLEERLDRLEDTHREVLAAAYENVAGHEPGAPGLPGAARAGGLRRLPAGADRRGRPRILGVEVIRLGLEAPAAEPGAGLGPAGAAARRGGRAARRRGRRLHHPGPRPRRAQGDAAPARRRPRPTSTGRRRRASAPRRCCGSTSAPGNLGGPARLRRHRRAPLPPRPGHRPADLLRRRLRAQPAALAGMSAPAPSDGRGAGVGGLARRSSARCAAPARAR